MVLCNMEYNMLYTNIYKYIRPLRLFQAEEGPLASLPSLQH